MSFSGGTASYQYINFIPVLNDIAAQFNIKDRLPSSLIALNLTGIQLTYTTGDQKKKEFTLTCSGELEISDAS